MLSSTVHQILYIIYTHTYVVVYVRIQAGPSFPELTNTLNASNHHDWPRAAVGDSLQITAL